MERDARLQSLFYISFRVPNKEALPPGSLHRAPTDRERHHTSRAPFILLTMSPVDEPSSRFPKWGHYGKRCPSPEPFLHILQGPEQGSPASRFPSQSSHRERERDTIPPEPLSTISQSPRYMSPLQVAQLSPHKERCPSPASSFHNLQGP